MFEYIMFSLDVQGQKEYKSFCSPLSIVYVLEQRSEDPWLMILNLAKAKF